MKTFVLFSIFLFLGCNQSKKSETTKAVKSFELSQLIFANSFVNLYDTTDVLQSKTHIGLYLSEDNISIQAYVAEDDIRFRYDTRDTCIWKDPCVEFFFDPGADGLDYYEMQFNAAPQVWDLKLKSSRPPVNKPDNVVAWDIGYNFDIPKMTGTKNDASDVDEFWSLDGTISWDKITETFTTRKLGR